MASEPAVRARPMKALLASVDALPAGRGPVVRSGIEPETLRAIEESSGVEWLPLEPCLQVHRAVHRAVGSSGSERFHRTHFLAALRSPLLRAFTRGALALYGANPESWMRFLPAGWSVLYRDCGAWTTARGAAGRATMTLRDLPRAPLGDRVWLAAIAASLSAVFDVARAEGSVVLADVDVQGR